jgi:hypothetical protein
MINGNPKTVINVLTLFAMLISLNNLMKLKKIIYTNELKK